MKKAIAVCLARMNEDFQTDFLMAISKRAREYGLEIQVYNTFEELWRRDRWDMGEESVYDLINYEELLGMIVLHEKIKDKILCEELIARGKEHNLPIVVVDKELEDCYSISYDYENSFEEIVRHMVDVHHCKTAFMMGGMRNNSFSDERIEVVRKVFEEKGLSFTNDDVGYGDFWDVPCRKEMERFLAEGRKLPDVFFAANDTMAITICDVLNLHGYSVPEDVYVTGFDGIEMEKYYIPRLTTAQQDIEMSGLKAIDTIYEHAKGKKDLPKKISIPFHVRIGSSCGCKEIVHSHISSQISTLYSENTSQRQFSKYMQEMLIALSGAKTVDELLEVLKGFVVFLEEHRSVYFCIYDYQLRVDKNYYRKLKNINPDSEPGKDDMVLVAKYMDNKDFTTPGIRFSSKELLPNYAEEVAHSADLAFIPLHMQDDVLGYMVVDLTTVKGRYYKDSLFSVTFSHCVDALRKTLITENANKKLIETNKKLEDLYIRDPLTEIYNRRGFYQEAAVRLQNEKNRYVLVISMDLDGLKLINDNYGHGEGDFAIRSVGKALEECVKDGGICARFGGDEFSAAVFFEEDQPEAQQRICEQIESAIAALNAEAKKQYPIGCSLGSVYEKIGERVKINDLLKKADYKMYAVKRQHHQALDEADNH